MKRIVPVILLLALINACSSPVPAKPRYVWIDAPAIFSEYGNSEENIARDCKRIAKAGFTDIVVDVRPTNGDVLFKSEVAIGPMV